MSELVALKVLMIKWEIGINSTEQLSDVGLLGTMSPGLNKFVCLQ